MPTAAKMKALTISLLNFLFQLLPAVVCARNVQQQVKPALRLSAGPMKLALMKKNSRQLCGTLRKILLIPG